MTSTNFLVLTRFLVLSAVATLLSTSGIRSQEQNTPTLSSLKLEFDVKRAELMKPVTELRKFYGEKLDELLDQVTGAGDLKKALAVKAEVANHSEGKSKVEEAAFPELKRLQAIFVKARTERLDEANQKLDPLVQNYKANLLALQKRLTQEKKLEEAVKIQGVLDSIEAEFSVTNLPPPVPETKEKTKEKNLLLGKTASFSHNTQPDFKVNVKFEAEGKATFIGLGNFAVEWAYDAGETPLLFYFWSHTQNRTKETGLKIVLDPDGKTGIVSSVRGSSYKPTPAKISRSRR